MTYLTDFEDAHAEFFTSDWTKVTFPHLSLRQIRVLEKGGGPQIVKEKFGGKDRAMPFN